MILDHLPALEAALVAANFPPMSPWWRSTFARFYQSGRRRLVLRVGRRGGKSSSLCRIAVLEALFGDHNIPPGDAGYVAIVSVDRSEAERRLRTVRAILDALRVAYREKGDAIELVNRPVIFAVFTATVSGVSGPTVIAAICDETAKWRDQNTGANPATEVLASLRPAMATMPNAKEFLSSSVVGLEDAHAKAYADGDTDAQVVAAAPTWIANPTLTESYTHTLETSDRVWLREYANQPQGSSLGAFDPEAIDAAFDVPALEHIGVPVIAMDAAGRGSDSFAWAVGGWSRARATAADRFLHTVVDGEQDLLVIERDGNGNPVRNPEWAPPKPFLYVCRYRSLDGSYRSGITAADVAKLIAQDAYSVGARLAVCDQFEAFGFESLLAQFGIRLNSYAWGGTSKARAVDRLRRMFNDRSVKLEPHAQLRRELLAFEERITGNGITYGGKDPTGGHFDNLSALLSLCMADMAGDLYASPTRRAHNIIEGTKPGRILNPFQRT